MGEWWTGEVMFVCCLLFVVDETQQAEKQRKGRKGKMNEIHTFSLIDEKKEKDE